MNPGHPPRPVSPGAAYHGAGGVCHTCRHDPCTCVTLCHGCDRELGPSRYCPDCAEIMPVYLHNDPRVPVDRLNTHNRAILAACEAVGRQLGKAA